MILSECAVRADESRTGKGMTSVRWESGAESCFCSDLQFRLIREIKDAALRQKLETRILMRSPALLPGVFIFFPAEFSEKCFPAWHREILEDLILFMAYSNKP